MEVLQLDIAAVLDSFRKAKDFNDFLPLLNDVVEYQNSEPYSEKKPFSRKQLTYNLKNTDSLYKTFQIPKKSGKPRTITAPNPSLKAIQRCLAFLLQNAYQPTISVNGFVPGRSVVSNATVHADKKFVLNLDLENFFPAISFGRVLAVLQLSPTLAQPKIATYLTQLACHNGFLPQGAPTSPVISNLICQRLDRRIEALVKSQEIAYTRYADDLTLSSDQPFQNGLLNHLDQIIQEEGFTINMEKVRLQLKNSRQEVTGLTVNEKVNVPRQYLREVRAMLHNWEKLGYEAAQQKFLSSYTPRISVKKKKGQPQLRNVVGGKINYLKMVRGSEDMLYLKLKEQYGKLEKGETVVEATKPAPEWQPVIDHNPRRVVSFLRNFRVVNDTGFRELLHDPDTSDFDFLANLEKVNTQLPGLKDVLTPKLHRKLTDFVNAYNTAGLAYYQKHGLLPLKGRPKQRKSLLAKLLLKSVNMEVEGNEAENKPAISPDKTVSKAANEFREQIRVGSDYFQDLILANALKPTIKALAASTVEAELPYLTINIESTDFTKLPDLSTATVGEEPVRTYDEFQPNEEEFGINCSFFTDSWEAVKAINSLMKDLAQNPFYETPDGKRDFWLRSAVIQRGTKENPFFASVIYVHLEKGKVIDGAAFAHARLQKTKQRLWSLADWSVLYQCADGENREDFFLNSIDNQNHQAPWYEGVTHKLTFYQS